MTAFWSWLDRTWLSLASVKMTLVIFVSLLLLSIPGTVILQFNISNVDPGLQYDYDFWKFGNFFQLFTAYHSFWYVGLMVLLSMNLIACSVERWPQMWKLANAKAVAWAPETFDRQPADWVLRWESSVSKPKALEHALGVLKRYRQKAVLVEDSADSFQVFYQTGRWSRISNYLVHTSLLVVFAGAIISSMYGFEGAANIPSGGAIDTFIVFKEGRASRLPKVKGGIANERHLGFRLKADRFDVNFYEDFPGRPKSFLTKLRVLENDKTLVTKEIRVNDPLEYKNFTFYQASYGRLGDFDLKYQVLSKNDIITQPLIIPSSHLGEVQTLVQYGVSLVPIVAVPNLQNLGPAVQFQEVKNDKATGKPFWVLQDYPEFEYRRESPYVILVDKAEELFFTGLQIGYDPGAPIYWTGCLGMLIGTFYALFVTHKKFFLSFRRGRFQFSGSIHSLPTGFEKTINKWGARFKSALR